MKFLIAIIVATVGLSATAQIKKINNRKLSCGQIAQQIKQSRRARVGRLLVQSSPSGCNVRSSARPATIKDKSGKTCTAGWVCRAKRKTPSKRSKHKKSKNKYKSKSRHKTKSRSKSDQGPLAIRVPMKDQDYQEALYQHDGSNITRPGWQGSITNWVTEISRYVEGRYRQGHKCILYVQGQKYQGVWARCLTRPEITHFRKQMKLTLQDVKDAHALHAQEMRRSERERVKYERRPNSEKTREGDQRRRSSAAESTTERVRSGSSSRSEAGREASYNGNENMSEGLRNGYGSGGVEGAREDGNEGAAENLSESGC